MLTIVLKLVTNAEFSVLYPNQFIGRKWNSSADLHRGANIFNREILAGKKELEFDKNHGMCRQRKRQDIFLCVFQNLVWPELNKQHLHI